MEYEKTHIYTGEEIQPAIDVEWLVSVEKVYEELEDDNGNPVLDENGKPKKVLVDTIYEYDSMSEGSDYRVEYSKNIAKGTATIKIIGIGGYTGSVSKTFKITSKEIYYKASEPDDEYEEDYE